MNDMLPSSEGSCSMRVWLIASGGMLAISACAAHDGGPTSQSMTAIYSPPVRLGGNGALMFVRAPEQSRSGKSPISYQTTRRRPIVILVTQNQGVVFSMQTPGLVNCRYPDFEGADTSHFRIVSEAAFRETDRLSSRQLKRKIALSKAMRNHNQNLFRTRYDQLRQVCPNVQLEAP